MRDKDDFARTIKSELTFEDLFSMYKRLKETLAEANERKEELEKRLREEKVAKGLSLEDQWKIYSIIKNLYETRREYYGIDLGELKFNIKQEYQIVEDLEETYRSINELTRQIESIFDEEITFCCFVGDDFDRRCDNKHYLVRFDDELKCINCGATTKDYDLSEEEIDFLVEAAKHQHIFIDEATKEDLPLLEVLMEEQEFSSSLGEPIDEDDPESSIDYEEQYLADLALVPELERQVKKAHLIDSRTKNNKNLIVGSSLYLHSEDAIELFENAQKSLEEAKASTSRFRNLMIEECYTAMYEICLLNGYNPSDLYNDLDDEDKKTAFIKAYYNVSRSVFRTNSDYFGDDTMGALSYDCVTANPEINNRILEMKVRR